MHVRLWDFGTLKSHSLKVSVQIFIQAAKMEEEIFNLSKITKNESKIIFFDICKYSGINLPSKMQFYLFYIDSGYACIRRYLFVQKKEAIRLVNKMCGR